MTLTEEQIRAMVPGPEMDAAVALALRCAHHRRKHDGKLICGCEHMAHWCAGRMDGSFKNYSTDHGEAFKALIQKHQHYRINEKGVRLFVDSADETTPYPCSGTGDIARDICVCILLAKMA